MPVGRLDPGFSISSSKENMNINITYVLDEHGWSSCFFNLDGKIHEISITHIYHKDPIEDCINSLVDVIQGKSITSFLWYGEPGGYRLKFEEMAFQKHKLKVSIEYFAEDFDEEEKTFEKEFDFEIEKEVLITMFYYEFKKIFKLLENKNYAKNRASEFPIEAFKKFQVACQEYLNKN